MPTLALRGKNRTPKRARRLQHLLQRAGDRPLPLTYFYPTETELQKNSHLKPKKRIPVKKFHRLTEARHLHQRKSDRSTPRSNQFPQTTCDPKRPPRAHRSGPPHESRNLRMANTHSKLTKMEENRRCSQRPPLGFSTTAAAQTSADTCSAVANPRCRESKAQRRTKRLHCGQDHLNRTDTRLCWYSNAGAAITANRQASSDLLSPVSLVLTSLYTVRAVACTSTTAFRNFYSCCLRFFNPLARGSAREFRADTTERVRCQLQAPKARTFWTVWGDFWFSRLVARWGSSWRWGGARICDGGDSGFGLSVQGRIGRCRGFVRETVSAHTTRRHCRVYEWFIFMKLNVR